MKKKALYALTCALILTSCNDFSIENNENPVEKQSPIQFFVQMEKETLSFPTTKSMPENTIGEPTSVSGESSEDADFNELCKTLEYVVFKEENNNSVLIKHRQYIYDESSLDVDFGIVYDTLPEGDYTFYFLAHNSNTATLSGSIFSFDSISDSFYKSIPLEIAVAETINEDVTLQRIVSRIEFMATDPITTELKQFDMEIEGTFNQLDITTGYGIQSSSSEFFSYLFKEEEIGKTNHIHGFYTFVPESEDFIATRLSAIDQNNEVIRTRMIDNILPQKNKIIRYKGRLYSRSESDNTFQISIYNNGKWEETTEVVLPEYE